MREREREDPTQRKGRMGARAERGATEEGTRRRGRGP